MQITKTAPTVLRLEGFPQDELARFLSYEDRSVLFELVKAKKNWRLKEKDPEAWKERVDELKQAKDQCLLFEDQDGLWTYSGLLPEIENRFKTASFKDETSFPEFGNIPWAKKPTKELRPYQQKMVELLLEERHGAVEVGTGLGKSFVILQLVKRIGLKTVVMAPSLSIAKQLYEEFKEAFGARYVGRFFDSKKESSKLFVVGVDDSLTKVKPGSEHWKPLSSAKVFIADESHQCPANSLSAVCMGLMKDAPFRFFFSGTQQRNDGRDMLLRAIIGKIVFVMTVEEGVNQGWLSKPMFRMIPIESSCTLQSPDPIAMTRAHFYYEPMVNAKAAQLANMFVEQGKQVLILIKELEQVAWLDRAWNVLAEDYGMERHEVRVAHSASKESFKKKKKGDSGQLYVPDQYRESDPPALVEAFNRKEFPILVGTSCITTGTDIQTPEAIIYLQGGRSEVQLRQAVGRGTRRPEGKTEFYFVDFNVANIDVTNRHAIERSEIYKEIYPDFEVLPL